MSMKQKLTYMLIGCLFTMAGYVLSSLFNTPTHVQAQDEKVIDEIVCKKLKIVNDEVKVVAELSGYHLTLYADSKNGKSETRAELGWMGLEIIGNNGKRISEFGILGVETLGFLSIKNFNGESVVAIGSDNGNGGVIKLNNADRERLVNIGSADGGKSVAIGNADGKRPVSIGSLNGENGDMVTYNADGKPRVHIGSEKGRPNDGLINIYNHKGEWRSFSAE